MMRCATTTACTRSEAERCGFSLSAAPKLILNVNWIPPKPHIRKTLEIPS
ncbi:MAG: hypothetical protein HOG15_01545 [Anaerolineae bacterium]|nr:hypothetical protein [Anaerolineae bacterium]